MTYMATLYQKHKAASKNHPWSLLPHYHNNASTRSSRSQFPHILLQRIQFEKLNEGYVRAYMWSCTSTKMLGKSGRLVVKHWKRRRNGSESVRTIRNSYISSKSVRYLFWACQGLAERFCRSQTYRNGSVYVEDRKNSLRSIGKDVEIVSGPPPFYNPQLLLICSMQSADEQSSTCCGHVEQWLVMHVILKIPKHDSKWYCH